MPSKAKRPCSFAQCPKLAIKSGYCQDHAKGEARGRNEARAASPRMYDDVRWRKARLSFLVRNPLCIECKRQGNTTAANEIDHITPHRGDKVLFWNRDNWQALCKSCHSRKTATEVNSRRGTA